MGYNHSYIGSKWMVHPIIVSSNCARFLPCVLGAPKQSDGKGLSCRSFHMTLIGELLTPICSLTDKPILDKYPTMEHPGESWFSSRFSSSRTRRPYECGIASA
jgi:hypothetical protein